MTIYDELREEREYQDKKWGHAFDDKNTINDWCSYITRYAGNAAFAETQSQARWQFLKVAALAIAAIEAFERNNDTFSVRHYDK